MDAVKGLVYLILFVAVGAGAVIAVLAWRLDKARKEAARLAREVGQLKRQLADALDKKRVEGLDDEALLDDLRGSLDRTRGSG